MTLVAIQCSNHRLLELVMSYVDDFIHSSNFLLLSVVCKNFSGCFLTFGRWLRCVEGMSWLLRCWLCKIEYAHGHTQTFSKISRTIYRITFRCLFSCHLFFFCKNTSNRLSTLWYTFLIFRLKFWDFYPLFLKKNE